MKKHIIISILLLSIFTEAKEISIEETVKFLQSKLDVSHTNSYKENGKKFSWKVSQSFIDNGNCNFTIRNEYIGMKKVNDYLGRVYGRLKEENIFDAKNLDYSKVYWDEGNSAIASLTMGTTENKKNILYKSYYYEPLKKTYCIKEEVEKDGGKIKFLNSKECIINYYYDEAIIFQILAPIEDNRPRVKKAMEHLIQMCGGKEELF